MEFDVFFETILAFLCENPKITRELIKDHWNPEFNKPNDIKIIFRRLCESAQNQTMAPNVVSKSINGFENLSHVLYNFNPNEIVKNYRLNDNLLLFEKIKETLKPRGKLRESENCVWPKFCRSVIEGAYYLSSFNSAQNFYSSIDSYIKDRRIKNLIPISLAFEIKGLGIALICDFLKEIGYKEYGKPDVHLKEILSAAGYLDSKLIKTEEGSYKTLIILDKMSDDLKLSQYEIDKTIWLVGSGNYYNSNIKTNNRKNELINILRR